MTLPRLRITYRRTVQAAEFQSGRLSRMWTEAFQCAGIPLARPEGSKRIRIELGPPLPQGSAGDAEVVDVVLAGPASPTEVVARLNRALPAGLDALHAEEIGERLPSLQASLRSACYRIVFDSADIDAAALRERVRAFLALETLPWEELRGERLRQFDLRPLVYSLAVSETPGRVVLIARLALSQERSGRPSSVLAALEIEAEPLELMRTEVEVERSRVALRAWRERGRFE
jgi:radical SAM-linked protein